MRVAALYDIHGNLPALTAVLSEVDRAQVDRIVIGGDVLPGPMPAECLARLSALSVPTYFIHGNGDREVLAILRGLETGAVPEAFREVMRWTARQVQSDYEAMLAAWPATVRLLLPTIGDVLFCHATPRNDTEIFTRLTADETLRPIFDGLSAAMVVCGHTHMQFDRTVGTTRVVNAGSVGMPFGEPGAYWLLLDDGVELRQTPYDLAAAAAQVRATAYPQADHFAAQNIVQPPTEQAILDLFATTELT